MRFLRFDNLPPKVLDLSLRRILDQPSQPYVERHWSPTGIYRYADLRLRYLNGSLVLVLEVMLPILPWLYRFRF